MKKNQNLLGIAFVLVAIQLFLLLLPTIRYTDDRAYYGDSEAYSAVQMVINYNDTVNDPGSDSSDATFIPFAFGAATVYFMLTAVANTVQALTFDHFSRKKLSLLCWASCFLAVIPFTNWLFLIIVFEEDIFITLLGFVQMALPVAFCFLFPELVPDTSPISSEYNEKLESVFKAASTASPAPIRKYCPHCGNTVTSNQCDMCGKEIIPTSERIPTWKRIQNENS